MGKCARSRHPAILHSRIEQEWPAPRSRDWRNLRPNLNRQPDLRLRSPIMPTVAALLTRAPRSSYCYAPGPDPCPRPPGPTFPPPPAIINLESDEGYLPGPALLHSPDLPFHRLHGAVSLAASSRPPPANSQHRIARVWAKMLLAVTSSASAPRGASTNSTLAASYVFRRQPRQLHGYPPPSSRGFLPVPVLRQEKPLRNPFLGTHLRRAATCRLSVSSPPRFAQEHDREWPLIAQRGVSVLLFPEGGRSPHGLRDFKDGAAYIAIKAGVPVVPIAIVGMRPLLPMGSIHIRRKGTVLLRVGDPIPHRGPQALGHTELTQRLYREVSHLLEDPVPSPAR